jgi:signal transduction histidine kinase
VPPPHRRLSVVRPPMAYPPSPAVVILSPTFFQAFARPTFPHRPDILHVPVSVSSIVRLRSIPLSERCCSYRQTFAGDRIAVDESMATAVSTLIPDLQRHPGTFAGRFQQPIPQGVRLSALRASLLVKVVGANALVVTALALLHLSGILASPVAIMATVAVMVVVHLALVIIALRPVRDLDATAKRVWRGDYGARVRASTIADKQVLRVGNMFNVLLDGLAADRARMRELATEVVEVSDRERAALARELHDSTAQRLAALQFQISAAARDCRDPEIAERLAAARDAAEEVTEEVRLLAHTVHPRVLDDLGLVAALQKLAREASRGTGIDVDVDASPSAGRLPKRISSVLYRVGQEAVRNATRHASPRHVGIVLRVTDSEAGLEVHDDGAGFDLPDAERRRPGMGLFTMRERVALVDGSFELRTTPGSGTTVLATIPLDGRAEEESRGNRNVR